MNPLLTLLGRSSVAETPYVDSVFSAWTYIGDGSTPTIATGIEANTVWIKGRSGATDHQLFNTTLGATKELITNSTAAVATDTDTLTAFSATGFTLGADANVNTNAATYVAWSFKDAPYFYGHDVVVKSGGSDTTVSFPELTTLGMVRVKRTDSTGSWYIWHRSLTAGKLLIGETPAAEATLGQITVSGTTVTLEDGVITNGTYLVEAWAHDTSDTGIIQCGSYVGNGATAGPVIALGWEPQYVLIKNITTGQSWWVFDSARGMCVGSADEGLNPNTSGAPISVDWISPTATGFQIVTTSGGANTSTDNYIYLAIRRPNKPPTSGTQVYNAIARTGTGAAATVTGVGFAPDLVQISGRESFAGRNWIQFDRLRGGATGLSSDNTGAEFTNAAVLLSDSLSTTMDGIRIQTANPINSASYTYINYFFRRAPGFFDEVCDVGTGSAHTIDHNLGVAPELMIRKKRSAADAWVVYANADPTDYLVLNTTAATVDDATIWNDTAPTDAVFTVGTHDDVNGSSATFVTYLFATLAGISKVGSYTGNGTSQTINCGFSTGARFVLVKRIDNTGSWLVVDTTRGLGAGGDPTLYLNSTSAEVTGDDWIDPDASGFIVNEEATMHANVNAATYIFLAVA